MLATLLVLVLVGVGIDHLRRMPVHPGSRIERFAEWMPTTWKRMALDLLRLPSRIGNVAVVVFHATLGLAGTALGCLLVGFVVVGVIGLLLIGVRAIF